MEIQEPNLGLPHTKAFGKGLFEIRDTGAGGIGRAFFVRLKENFKGVKSTGRGNTGTMFPFIFHSHFCSPLDPDTQFRRLKILMPQLPSLFGLVGISLIYWPSIRLFVLCL